MPLEEVGVRAVLEGVATYEREAARVNTATQRIVTEAAQAARNAQSQASALQTLGSRMQQAGQQAVLLGGALAGPGLAAVHFAVQFESAFAGVRKTVDATDAELATLRTGLLDLSRAIPTSPGALAGIAEAAGQLGVAKGDILAFTDVTAKLAETTNLTTEEAATSLARFANILKIPQSELSNVASALVDLGNKGAATESEILDFALRLSGAGNVIGLSADEVLGFGNALASLGINAEAGGTAFSRVFVEIAKSVEEGGKKLDQFAQVAGQTGSEFAASFKADAANAVISFVEGLGKITDEGGATFQTLEDLSLGDNRLRDSLLRASGAGDLLRESLANGATAFRENSALTTEFEKRLNTTSAQFKLFLNDLQNLAITAGTVLLPTLRGLIGAARDLADTFAGLPAPLQGAVAGFTLLAGGAIATVGALGFVVGNILQVVSALPGMIGGIGAAATALRSAAVASAAFAITPLGAALIAAGVAAAGAALLYRKLTADSEEVRAAHQRLSKANDELGKAVAETSRQYVEYRKAVDAAVAGKNLGDSATIAGIDAEARATANLTQEILKHNAAKAGIPFERETGAPAPTPGEPPRRGLFGALEPGQPEGPTPRGTALLEQVQATQQSAKGAGFRRTDVDEAARANFDFAKSLLGIEDPLARIDPLVLAMTESLTENERAVLKNASAAAEAKRRFLDLSNAAGSGSFSSEAADRGGGQAQATDGAQIAQLQKAALLDVAEAERAVALAKRDHAGDADRLFAAESQLVQAHAAVGAAARAETAASDAVAAASANLATLRNDETASDEQLADAREKLRLAQGNLNAITTAGVAPQTAYANASKEVQAALRNLERVQGDTSSTADDLQRAQDRVNAALHESYRIGGTLPGIIGGITNAQQALADSASEATIKQNALNQALLRTALARASAIPEVFTQGADQDAEAAGVGDPRDFKKFGNAGLTPSERLELIQKEGADAVAAVEAQLAADREAASKATAAASKAEQEYKQSLAGRTAETIKQLEASRAQARGEAILREALGVKGPKLAEVEAQQAAVDAAFAKVRDKILASGVEISESVIAVFDNLAATAKSKAEEALASNRESRAQALGKALIGQELGLEGLKVSEIESQQSRADAVFARLRDKLVELGIEVPEGMIDAIDSMIAAADEAAKKGEHVGGILGFLLARRIGAGANADSLISQTPSQQAALSPGAVPQPVVNFNGPVTYGSGVTTGDIAQGTGVAYRTALSQT